MSFPQIPLALSAFYLLCKVFIQADTTLVSILVFGLSISSSLRPSLCEICSSALIAFLDLYWTNFSKFLFFFYWGNQELTQHYRCLSPGLSRGDGSPFSTCWQHFSNTTWDAAVDLCHEGTLLAYVQPAVHQDPPSPFLQSCFPAVGHIACTSAWNYTSPDAGLCISFC